MITCLYEILIPQISELASPGKHHLNWNYCDVYTGTLSISAIPPFGARIPLFGSYDMVAIVLSIDVLTPGKSSDIVAEVILNSVDGMKLFKRQAKELGFVHPSTGASIHNVASPVFFSLFLSDALRQRIQLS